MNSLERDDWIRRLGPEVLPYTRYNQDKTVREEERIDLSSFSFDAINDGSPIPDLNFIDEERSNLPNSKKYIWLIYVKKGEINFRIIPDSYPNNEGKKKLGRENVCHTNLSGGKLALQGGECWWSESSKTMYVNDQSGRYPSETEAQFQAVIEFFKFVGYKNVIDARIKI
ncbi:hypothetical protein [Leptospira santarosai]|uniref:PH domain-containing protein n=1 Tax=Leptospira santarosai TaxID=28183 RepID=A0AB73LKF9_9LEPT|nr:hypothetical protein [Leptospira santarosai]ONF90885.1 hypothetical protein BWD14_19110 [Leptospira santarosai]